MSNLYKDKALSRFAVAEEALAFEDLKFERIPTSALILEPHWCVTPKGLYFPATPGIDGVLLAKFKSPDHARAFVKCFIPFPADVAVSVGGASGDVKFVLNRWRGGGGAPVYSPTDDSDGVYGSNKEDASFHKDLRSDCYGQLRYILGLIDDHSKHDPAHLEETFPYYSFYIPEGHVGVAFAAEHGQASHNVMNLMDPKQKLFDNAEREEMRKWSPRHMNSAVDPDTGEYADRFPPYLIGVREHLLLAKIMKKFYKEKGIPVTGHGSFELVDSKKFMSFLWRGLLRLKRDRTAKMLMRSMMVMQDRIGAAQLNAAQAQSWHFQDDVAEAIKPDKAFTKDVTGTKNPTTGKVTDKMPNHPDPARVKLRLPKSMVDFITSTSFQNMYKVLDGNPEKGTKKDLMADPDKQPFTEVPYGQQIRAFSIMLFFPILTVYQSIYALVSNKDGDKDKSAELMYASAGTLFDNFYGIRSTNKSGPAAHTGKGKKGPRVYASNFALPADSHGTYAKVQRIMMNLAQIKGSDAKRWKLAIKQDITRVAQANPSRKKGRNTKNLAATGIE